MRSFNKGRINFGEVFLFCTGESVGISNCRGSTMPEHRKRDIGNKVLQMMEERERPLDTWDRCIGSKGCFLRKAKWEDVDLLFSWANDKEVRKNSFSTEPIDYEGHLAWFGKKYQEKNSQIYIFSEGNGRENQEKGMLRLDFYEGAVEISYSIAPGERQKGYGEKLILLAEDEVRHVAQKEGFQAITVKACVKPQNRASNCIFTKLGYEKHGMEYRKTVNV